MGAKLRGKAEQVRGRRRVASAAGRALLGVLAVSSMTACETVDRQRGAYRANNPAIDPQRLGTFLQHQDEVWDRLVAFADNRRDGDRSPANVVGPADANFDHVVAAGIHYVDVRCEEYVDALFWFHRYKEAGDRQVQYFGAAATAAMRILEASKDLISLTPLGITLADQTIDNFGKGLLFELDPAIVRSLVERQQAAYRAEIKDTHFTTKAASLQAVQGFLAICLPASLEMEVNTAVGRTGYKPKETGNEPPPATTDPNATPPTETGNESNTDENGPPARKQNEVPVLTQTEQPQA